ncbi:NnrU family protein [Gymnodinialimonas ceratoperidinii]|uniref:NnrU family protein n=1 Tax=Gymnodinialimonas ceratoperidinii TaxID=2856823 RepID=A0A8F6YB00_9RHOB|nr:NnrU family protein [Gymnodinialimonas ceratoperidinii]QXT40464.1 NnrU family protein [Gymnodinialimonas ceratoperidinii]
MIYWILLIAGVALWSGAHLWKRVAPASRARLGDKGRGIVALLSIAAIVLMVIGYRGAYGPVWWGRSPALVGINNLLMIFAFYLFAAAGAKTWITGKIKNPQLTAFKIWAVAHLLVNGDLASFVLFGGLLAWAVVEVIVLKRHGEPWTPPHPVPVRKEITTVVATIVVVIVVMGLHYALGAQPWG